MRHEAEEDCEGAEGETGEADKVRTMKSLRRPRRSATKEVGDQNTAHIPYTNWF